MRRLLLPSADGARALEALQQVEQGLAVLPSGPHERFRRYFEWVSDSALRLRTLLPESAIRELVLTPTVTGLLGMDQAAFAAGGARLLEVEIELRRGALREAIETLGEMRARWSRGEILVVLDTNVFLHHPQKLELLEWSQLVGAAGPVRLLIPIIVLDEIDRQKRGPKDVRSRAKHTTRLLARLVTDPTLVGCLHDPVSPDGASQARVRVEIVPDPANHVRLPLPDDEIIDRALMIQQVAGREVLLLTYDSGMQMRARSSGLRVRPSDEALGEELGTE